MASTGTAVVTLPTDTQVRITREFAAPRHLVYRAWTTPSLIARWWTANRGDATVVEVDLRVGGAWRWVMVTPEGYDVAFHGVYRAVVENERLVHTEAFEGAPEAEAVTTVTFDESDAGTRVTILVQHRNRAERDAHVESGMESGLQDALDLLERLAVSMMEA
jgi:uncharacterized protein YndB with AHSA1/START domain